MTNMTVVTRATPWKGRSSPSKSKFEATKSPKKGQPKMVRPFNEIDESTFQGRFAARLRNFRVKTKLTGPQLAMLITEHGHPISGRAYMDWEAGKACPPMQALPAIAKSVGVSVRNLLPEK